MRLIAIASFALIAACGETAAPTPSAASARPAPAPASLPQASRPAAAAPNLSRLTPAQQAARMVDRSMGQDTQDAEIAAARGSRPSEGSRNALDVGAMGSYPAMTSQPSPAFRGQ